MRLAIGIVRTGLLTSPASVPRAKNPLHSHITYGSRYSCTCQLTPTSNTTHPLDRNGVTVSDIVDSGAVGVTTSSNPVRWVGIRKCEPNEQERRNDGKQRQHCAEAHEHLVETEHADHQDQHDNANHDNVVPPVFYLCRADEVISCIISVKQATSTTHQPYGDRQPWTADTRPSSSMCCAHRAIP